VNPDLWQRVSRVFDRVADRPRSERAALLDELCAGDAGLRREVETLLAAAGDADAFLEQPYTAPAPADYSPAAQPRRVGPWLVEREIGRGGMGVVYLARHSDYPKAVALKVMHPWLEPELLRTRFRRERDILAGLEHAGIARLHDGGSAEDGTPFLAMEYVEGATLLEWADSRRLTTSARLELFLEVCAAVEYAHQRQVLHRDLKPSNILVTLEGTPKLLDFGVAKLLEAETGEERDPTLLTAAPLMTPEYASPEQVRGEPVGPASDVYSLGVVLYELLTGRRPYRLVNRTAREIERAVCETDPQRPSAAVQQSETGETASAVRDGTPDKLRRRLRGDLDAIVLKALRKDTGARYAAVADLADDLRRHNAGYPVIARRGTWRYRAAKFVRRHRTAAAVLGLATLTLFAGAALTLIGLGSGGTWTFRLNPPGAPARRGVAILPFKNLSGDGTADWISPTLGEMLRTELAATDALRVISGEQVSQAVYELGLSASDGYGVETLLGLRRKTGSDWVVLGSYLAAATPDGPLRIDVRVQDCRSGEMVAEVAEIGTRESILDLVGRAGLGLRSRLGLPLSSEDAEGLRARRPTSPEAARFYAEGVAYRRRYDYGRAAPLLESAIAAEPGFAPAHLELALVLAIQGYQKQAEENARVALQLAPPAPGRARLEIEARVRFVLQDWDGATRAYRALREIDPENLEWGLELTRALHAGGRATEALATLAELRDLPPPVRDDPRIDLQEARISTDTAQVDRALAATLAKSEAVGATLVAGHARWVEGVNAASRGDGARGEQAMEESRRLFEDGGDRVNAARATAMLGFTRFGNGDPAGAAELLRGAIASPRMSDLPAARRYALTLLGFVEEGRAEWPAARAAFAEAQSLSRELGNIIEPVQGARVALIDFFLGRGAESRQVIEQAGTAVAAHPTWLSEVNQLLVAVEIESDPAVAARVASEGMAADRAAGSELNALAFQRLLGYAQLQLGEVDAARATLEEAVSALEERGQTWEVAQTRMALAEALLAAGDAAGAETAARAAASSGGRWSALSPRLPSGSTVHCRALLEQGRLVEAAAALGPPSAAAQRGASPLHRLAVGVDAARLRAARGDGRAALDDLGSIAAEGARRGYRLTAFRARLAHDQMLAGVDPGRGDKALRALADEARRAGFGWVAAQADGAVERPTPAL
jgi:serine/threonine-protein kinase